MKKQGTFAFTLLFIVSLFDGSETKTQNLWNRREILGKGICEMLRIINLEEGMKERRRCGVIYHKLRENRKKKSYYLSPYGVAVTVEGERNGICNYYERTVKAE